MILRRSIPALLSFYLFQTAHAQIKVIGVQGDAELIRARGGAESTQLVGGEEVSEKDRIITGMDSAVQLQFGGNSVVVVKELTDFKVGEFAQDEDSARTRLWLKAGEVSAEVNPNKSGQSDFSVKTPTATCSVRGTGIDVAHAGGQTQQRTRHGAALFFSDSGRSMNNANQGATAEADGEFTTQSDQDLQEAVVTSLPSGASDGEEQAVENNGPQSNSGGAAPGDDAGAGASNDGLTNLVETVNQEVFDEIIGNNDLPLPDPDDPGRDVLAQLQARTGPGGGTESDIPGAPVGPDEFSALSLPVSSSLIVGATSTPVTHFVGKGSNAANEGLFRTVNGTITPLYFVGDSKTPFGQGGPITFDHFDFDGSFTADEPVLDSSDGNIVAFQATFDGSHKGIFVHDGDPGTGVLKVMVDNRGTHGQNFSTISNHFSLDGFIVNQPEVAFVGGDDSLVNEKIFFSKGVSDPCNPAFHEFGVSEQDAGFRASTSGSAFRDLSYRISDQGGGILRREVAFVADIAGGGGNEQGVFLQGINQDTSRASDPTMNNGFTNFESPTTIATTMQAIPDGAGVDRAGSSFDAFRSASISRNLDMNPGEVAFIGDGTLVNPGDFEGIFTTVGTAPGVTAVVDTASTYTISGFNSGSSFQFDHFDAVSFDSGIVSFSASLGGGSSGKGLFSAPLNADGTRADLLLNAATGDILATGNPNADGAINGITLGVNGADGAASALITVDAPPIGGGTDFTGIYQGGVPQGSPAIP